MVYLYYHLSSVVYICMGAGSLINTITTYGFMSGYTCFAGYHFLYMYPQDFLITWSYG